MNAEIKDFFPMKPCLQIQKIWKIMSYLRSMFCNRIYGKLIQKYSYLGTQLQSFLNHLPRQGLVLGPGEERELFYTFLERG